MSSDMALAIATSAIEMLCDGLPDGGPEFGLCREMPKDRGLGHANLLRDVIGGQPVGADTVGQVQNGRDDFRLAIFG